MEQSFTSSMIPTLTASSPRLDLSRNLLTFSSLNSTLLFRIYGSHSISQVGKPSSLRLLSHSYSSTPSLNSQEVSETASLPCPERKASKKASHLRPHLLATLPRADFERTREHSRSGEGPIDTALRLSGPAFGQGKGRGRVQLAGRYLKH